MRKRTRSFGYSLAIGLCFVIAILFFMERTQAAADIALPSQYYFVVNGQPKKSGTEIELKSSEFVLSVSAGTWEPSTTVEWVSSEPNIVQVQKYSEDPSKSNYVKLVRKGPGYSTITARVTYVSGNDRINFDLSCVVKVDLQFDMQKTGMTTARTTNEKILILDSVNQTKQVYLKYVDYTPEGGATPVSGDAISVSAVNWESSNEGVATVDENGVVKAVGAGSTTITATTKTMSASDKTMSISMKVIVAPKFEITYKKPSGSTVTARSYNDEKNPNAIADGVPSNFVIESNAALAKNLKWEVIDCSTNKKIPQGKSEKMEYSISDISGNVTFTNVKAGTYKIYAFADSNYNVNTNAPYAYLKIIVPVNIGDMNLVMNVGDTFNLIENSNITGVGFFGTPKYIIGGKTYLSQDYVEFDQNYVIRARREGKVTIELEYNSSLGLFDTDYPVSTVRINVTIIDGISLSATSATIYTNGTLLLTALATNPYQTIVWESDNPSVATVKDGLVTGIKEGVAIITASQTINGIVKTASCVVRVEPSVSKIEIEPASKTLGIGDFATLHAKVTPDSLKNTKLKWQSSNPSVVKIVEEQPLTVTIQALAGGSAVISAINQDNVVVGYCHVSVRQPVTGITLSETSGVLKLSDKSFQLRAIVSPENAYDKRIKWTSTDPSVAKVNDNGLVTPVKAGKVTIIATSVDNPAVTAMCNLTIEVPVASISLDEKKKTMYVGDKARLSYIISPENAANNAVTWTSTNTSVVTVDAKGQVTAKAPGEATIIIRTADGGRTDLCVITVKQKIDSVKLDVSKLDLKVGDYYYIKASITPKDATDIDLTWESSDTKVATVDADGKVMAKAPGTAFIMVKSKTGGTAYCEVTVRQPVTGIMLNFTDKTIYAKQSFQLNASVLPSTASNLNVTWKSSNDKVATVSKNGEVTGVAGGTAIITATTVDGGFSASCVVTVKEDVVNIKLNYDSYILGQGKSFVLEATVISETASNQNVIWISSDEDIATVDSKGRVKGIAQGEVTITAIAEDGSGAEASCEVTVVKSVTKISISKTYMTMYVGDSKTLKASVEPSKATIKTLEWKSSDTDIAIVDDNGVVTALKAGTVTITAKAQDNSGKQAVCTVTVYEKVPATSVTLQDKKLTMVKGESKSVNYVLNPTNSTDGVKWSTDNPSVATVDKKTGRITAKGIGTAYITAMTDSGKTATIEITVIGLNFTSITLEQYTRYQYQLAVEGATGRVKWNVDNPAIAEINNGYIVSKGIGTATVTANVNGRKLYCKVTVVKIK